MNQQRCSPVAGNTSRTAFRNPGAPAPTAGLVMPRRRQSCSRSAPRLGRPAVGERDQFLATIGTLITNRLSSVCSRRTLGRMRQTHAQDSRRATLAHHISEIHLALHPDQCVVARRALVRRTDHEETASGRPPRCVNSTTTSAPGSTPGITTSAPTPGRRPPTKYWPASGITSGQPHESGTLREWLGYGLAVHPEASTAPTGNGGS